MHMSGDIKLYTSSNTYKIHKLSIFGVLTWLLLIGMAACAEPDDRASNEGADAPVAALAKSMALRAIGPAAFGGRIADIAIHPEHPRLWYVAAGSGGVWKTTNAGITWTAIFDEAGSYSIGDVTVDPTDPNVVWVGTGENVSGRHVGWGDGVYRSRDGGASWVNTGLRRSEHISRILIDPRDSDVVYAAAEGPLWSSGGERGVYKTTDGGNTWNAVLEIDEDTGVADIAFHPTNPDVVYAAAYQRRRHVWGLMAGGPESGIYKTADGGATWVKKTQGLPEGDMGKIGLAVSEASPHRVYATIEASQEERGFYRSDDSGESWVKKNDYISGGTGPHYYQEIVASQKDPDLVYQMDVFMRVTRDGGATFNILETGRDKHSDNHALWIDPQDDFHLIAGTDAGLYESFDQGVRWRHFPNLPISQFYKVAVDDALPFYNILSGAQDLGTVFGPSRTTMTEGIRNRDWYIPLGADGYGVAFDPSDNNISYMEYQQGVLFRHERDSNEVQPIQPVPAPGEPAERWNWDTPFLISPHMPSRIYVGSQRFWRSDDRGDSWRAVSGDLTTGRNRYEMPYDGRVWSVDALHDAYAMSKFATLTSISESPIAEGQLYAGSDDGLIHESANGGETWSRAAPLPEAPEGAFINDVEASHHDPNTVFAVADAHKLGDYSPYVFVSEDRGKTWSSISGNLPDGTIAWAIQQDHVNPNLLFLGAEYALYFSLDGGAHWFPFAGAPPIAFRDIKIHRRDDDLIGATFGRGIYVLDDYGPLRAAASQGMDNAPTLFPVRDAWRYVPSVPSQARGMPTHGSDSFRTPNPEFGAVFTYYLPESIKLQKERRREQEKALRQEGASIPFPGWDVLTEEAREATPRLLFLVRDAEGNPIRWLAAINRDGAHRVAWDLRGPAPDPVQLDEPDFRPPWVTPPIGPIVAPGRYSVQLYAIADGASQALTEAQTFMVKSVAPLTGEPDDAGVAAYQQAVGALIRNVADAEARIARAGELLTRMQAAALRAPGAGPDLFLRLDAFGSALDQLKVELSGDEVRHALYEPITPSIRARANLAVSFNSTKPPTATQRTNRDIARRELEGLESRLSDLLSNELDALETALAAAGAPSWR